jgi:para-aminobenzoate synthetase / 4-amino-4-deoxychorismate lyase
MSGQQSWALFEDRLATSDGRARLYLDPVGSVLCAGPAQLRDFFERIDAWHRAGLFVVLVFDYEFGDWLEPIGSKPPGGPAAAALAFRGFESGSSARLEDWIDSRLAWSAVRGPAGVCDVRAAISYDEYARRFAQVQQYIGDGHTYQINLTFPLRFQWFGEPLTLFRRLRDRQRVSYGAFVELADRTVVCLSPELFVQHTGDLICTRPMKGTRPRGADPQQDLAIGRQMQVDPKSRAENLMIVDLLRNDLGRVCEIGSVRVQSLFDLEVFDTVLQLTSTVQGRLRPDVGLESLLRALFPCGSVTGAPKFRSRQIIEQIEQQPRGVYTGSIGYLDPDGSLLLNVAIRTLELKEDRSGRLGIGGGIVADSVCADEWDECFVKARFLVDSDPGFCLIETMRARRPMSPGHDRALDSWITLWPQHEVRLSMTARHFGFCYERPAVERAVLEALRSIGPEPQRARLILARSGRVEVTCEPLPAQAVDAALPRVGIAAQTIRSTDWQQCHKTTHRPVYGPALRDAQANGLWDVLFFNEHTELVEGARSSVFLRLSDELVTPPLSSGALPGVQRARILADPSYRAVERTLVRSDLQRASEVYLCNAVRGLFRVQLA